jgi:hypothetical protein
VSKEREWAGDFQEHTLVLLVWFYGVEPGAGSQGVFRLRRGPPDDAEETGEVRLANQGARIAPGRDVNAEGSPEPCTYHRQVGLDSETRRGEIVGQGGHASLALEIGEKCELEVFGFDSQVLCDFRENRFAGEETRDGRAEGDPARLARWNGRRRMVASERFQ